MRNIVTASLAVVSLSSSTAAEAQDAVEQAQAAVVRLLQGAGHGLTTASGREFEGSATFSNVRSDGRCGVKYALDYPNSDQLPEQYRGFHDDDASMDWAKDMDNPEAEGSIVYYTAVGNLSGRVRRFHFEFGSPFQAQEFVAAASTLIKACTDGGGDDGPVDEQVIDPRGKVASLAIDRNNGNSYGWAIDWETIEVADRRALEECGRNGPSCHVVLRFTGGCGAYAVDTAKGSTIYGWGTSATRAEAENRAWSEASKRGGTHIVTRVWGCNSIPPTPSASDVAAAARAERTRQFEEALRKHDEEVKAHDAAMEDYRKQLEANKDALEKAAERGQAAKSGYEAELAKAKAAQEQYERDQQAYREEYKRLTGHYPEGQQ